MPEDLNQNELWAQVVARAWSEPDYKARLLSDPKAALEEETGVSLPESLNVRIIEEGSDEVALVLPKNPAELSEEDLEGVAGGDNWGGQGPCSCLVG